MKNKVTHHLQQYEKRIDKILIEDQNSYHYSKIVSYKENVY